MKRKHQRVPCGPGGFHSSLRPKQRHPASARDEKRSDTLPLRVRLEEMAYWSVPAQLELKRAGGT